MEWKFINAFNFAGNNYTQWIRMISQNPDGTHNFEHKTELATPEDIRKAEENSVRFFANSHRKSILTLGLRVSSIDISGHR